MTAQEKGRAIGDVEEAVAHGIRFRQSNFFSISDFFQYPSPALVGSQPTIPDSEMTS
jgi:hypothetical protein